MVQARKRFGQNFLEDKDIISKMLSCVQQDNPSRVLEIGPGLGALTIPMLQSGIRVEAIEIDYDIIDFLKDKLERFLRAGSCQITQSDILNYQLDKHLHQDNIDLIFSNLPYNISTPFFLKLIFEKIYYPGYFLVQKEVAQRLCAQPGTSNYGRLTVMVSSAFSFTELFDVPPTAFHPAPKVHSTFIKMQPLPTPFIVNKTFEQLIKMAFSQRRKKISNTLKDYHIDFDSLGLDANVRAQDLSLEQYIKIFRTISA